MAATPTDPAATPAITRPRREIRGQRTSRVAVITTMAIPPATIAVGASHGRKPRYPDHR